MTQQRNNILLVGYRASMSFVLLPELLLQLLTMLWAKSAGQTTTTHLPFWSIIKHLSLSLNALSLPPGSTSAPTFNCSQVLVQWN